MPPDLVPSAAPSWRRALVPALLLALALLGGCGDDDGGEGSEPEAESSETATTGIGDETTGACSLVSADEVSEAVGVEVGPGRATSSPVATGGTQQTCEWFAVDSPADTAKVTIYTETSAADSVKDADPDAVPLDGIGDEAFVSSFASVWVYQGDQSFMAQWYSMLADDAENQPKSEALARLVSGAL